MSEYVIRADTLGKRYKIGAVVNRSPTLRDAIVNAATWPVRAIRRQLPPSKDEITAGCHV
jgi:hypothetical protein